MTIKVMRRTIPGEMPTSSSYNNDTIGFAICYLLLCTISKKRSLWPFQGKEANARCVGVFTVVNSIPKVTSFRSLPVLSAISLPTAHVGGGHRGQQKKLVRPLTWIADGTNYMPSPVLLMLVVLLAEC
jgi:hypothetical protein